MSAARMSAEAVEAVQLTPQQELRFILGIGDTVTLEIFDGSATSFGWRLPLRTHLVFREQPFPIATSSGCHVKFSGTYRSYYTARHELPSFISQIADPSRSPIVFIVGAPGVGKTSICKLILNTIFSHGHRVPYYVNADPSQAPFCPPGCIGTIPISSPIDNCGFPFTDPLCYFYAETSVEEKRQSLYIDQLAELNIRLQGRRKQFPDGGVVVDFPAVTSKCIHETLERALEIFQATHIVAMADDRLAVALRRKFPRQHFEKIGPLAGAVPLGTKAKHHCVNRGTRRYFYGDIEHPLNPTTYMVTKDAVKLYSLGPLDLLGKGLLPGAMPTTDPKVATPVAFGLMLNGTIMALIKDTDKTGYWKQNVVGFLHVMGQENEDKKFPVLMPGHGDLPSKTILASRVTWVDKA
jgi:hypothetical protein